MLRTTGGSGSPIKIVSGSRPPVEIKLDQPGSIDVVNTALTGRSAIAICSEEGARRAKRSSSHVSKCSGCCALESSAFHPPAGSFWRFRRANDRTGSLSPDHPARCPKNATSGTPRSNASRSIASPGWVPRSITSAKSVSVHVRRCETNDEVETWLPLPQATIRKP